MDMLIVTNMNHSAAFCHGSVTSRSRVRMKDDLDTATDKTAKNWPMGRKYRSCGKRVRSASIKCLPRPN